MCSKEAKLASGGSYKKSDAKGKERGTAAQERLFLDQLRLEKEANRRATEEHVPFLEKSIQQMLSTYVLPRANGFP